VLRPMCFEALPLIERPFCPVRYADGLRDFICDGCKGVAFGFEIARAPLRYEGLGEEIIDTLRYRCYTRVIQRLAAQLMLGVLDSDVRFDAVMPAPALHRPQRTRRGFNQAELLARGAARKINSPVSGTLQVVRRTQDQVELSAAERRANFTSAFRARGRLRGRVLLIDDVFTTGATMSACAETLLRAGAGEVRALSLCRTV
jgi:competence protein ComFC